MAYDLSLAERIRRVLGPRADVSERKMFGGVAFMLDGKMFCGLVGEDLMVRVGPELHAQALAEPHARPMDFTGRPMKGYVFVAPAGTRTEKALARWLDRALAFVATVERAPPKKRSRPRPFPTGGRPRAR